jgi:hypothetical protein
MLQSVRSQDWVLSGTGLSCWPPAYAHGRQASLLCSRPVRYAHGDRMKSANTPQIDGTLRFTELLLTRPLWTTRANIPVPRTPQATSTESLSPSRRFTNRACICLTMVLVFLRSYMPITNAVPDIRRHICGRSFGNHNESGLVTDAEK